MSKFDRRSTLLAESSFYKLFPLMKRKREIPLCFSKNEDVTYQEGENEAGRRPHVDLFNLLTQRTRTAFPSTIITRSPPPPPDTTRWCLCSAKVICCLFDLSRVSTQKSSKGPVRLLRASCAPLARSRVALELTLGAGQSQGPAAPTLPPTKPPWSVRSPLIPSLLSGIVLSTICSSLGRNLGIFPLGCNLITPNI